MNLNASVVQLIHCKTTKLFDHRMKNILSQNPITNTDCQTFHFTKMFTQNRFFKVGGFIGTIQSYLLEDSLASKHSIQEQPASSYSSSYASSTCHLAKAEATRSTGKSSPSSVRSSVSLAILVSRCNRHRTAK